MHFEYFMGQCTTRSRPNTARNYPHECEPAGTEALRDKNLPKLLFHATLANVRLKQYPYVAFMSLSKRLQPIFGFEKGRVLPWLQRIATIRVR